MNITAALLETTVTTRDEAWFDGLLRMHRQRLYGIAYTILRDHGEAEDALQESMWRAWKNRAALRDEIAAEAWLTQICVRHSLTRLRKLTRWLLNSNPDHDEPAPPEPRFEGHRLDLDRAFRRLSPRQRTAIALHYQHGYTVDECAELMGCGSGSVRTHVTRALASLRQEIPHD